MCKIFGAILNTTLAVAVASLISCGDDKPPAPATQSHVVSKKIVSSQPKSKPIAEKSVDGSKSPSQPGKVLPAKVQPQNKGATPPNTTSGKPAAGEQPASSDLIKASLQLATTYDPAGRFDPFEPLFTDEPEVKVAAVSKDRKKRVPQTPLEKVAISQLKLTAIMRTPQGNRALVEDATGKGYVVKKGTYMGLNAGQVIRIDRDRVVIEEEIQNMVGEYIINNAELKLQKLAGEQ